MIEINNTTTARIQKKFLEKIAKIVLKREFAIRQPAKQEKKINLSIAIVNPGRIKELNKKYRKKNRPTDVLSFRYNNSGEIVICLQEVKKNVKRFNSTFKEELARVLIHGILHLLGQNHEKSKKKAERMEKKQNHYLKKIIKDNF